MAEQNPLKIHNLRPAPGARPPRPVSVVVRRRRVRRPVVVPRHQGPLPGSGALRGRPDAAAHAPPEAEGFKNPFKTEYQVVNLDKLAALYPEGGEVTVEGLVAKGAVRKNSLVKVLGQGEVSVALQVTVDAVSGSAKEKITAAGGTVTELV